MTSREIFLLMGYTPEEIDAIDAAYEKNKDEIDAIIDQALNDMYRPIIPPKKLGMLDLCDYINPDKYHVLVTSGRSEGRAKSLFYGGCNNESRDCINEEADFRHSFQFGEE